MKLQLERLQQESSRLAEERTKLLEEQETQESHHKVLEEQQKAITDREKEADGKLQQAMEMHEVSCHAITLELSLVILSNSAVTKIMVTIIERVYRYI